MGLTKNSSSDERDADISIIGPGMKVVGDLLTEGTVRIEGRIEGNVQAGKAVVVGTEGEIQGDIRTEDSVISGRVRGSVTAASRLEVQAAARIDGELHARRLQLEEGAVVNGTVRMGEVQLEPEGASEEASSTSDPESVEASDPEPASTGGEAE